MKCYDQNTVDNHLKILIPVGTAIIIVAEVGIVHECNTSVAVIIIWIKVFIGKAARGMLSYC